MFLKRFYHINMLEIKWSEGFNCKVISYTNHTFIKFLFLRYYPVCYQPIKFRILWTAISSLISSVFIMDGSLCVFLGRSRHPREKHIENPVFDTAAVALVLGCWNIGKISKYLWRSRKTHWQVLCLAWSPSKCCSKCSFRCFSK